MRLRCDPGARVILPDYAVPDALCIPFWRFDIQPMLEDLAREAARHIGVILIGPDPEAAREFARETDTPDHFAVVSGALDSPWLRDHAPLAVSEGGALHHVRPRRREAERPQDRTLFASVLPGATAETSHYVASGNLVAGPDGLAFSTLGVLVENQLDDAQPLVPDAALMGLRDWHFTPAFPDDSSAHTDGMIRFLAPDLCAVARRSDGEAALVSVAIQQAVARHAPGIEVLLLDVETEEAGFTSPLNWIQIDKVLLVPDFGDGPGLDAAGQAALAARGFDLRMINCETRGKGGALRCLTAAVFASVPAP